MIVRQSAQRQGQCLLCSLRQPSQSQSPRRSLMTRAELAIPRHDLLDERISGPSIEEIRARVVPVRKFSSPKTPSIMAKHRLMQHWKATTGKLGSTIDEANLPGNLILTAPSPDEVTLELLMASQAHMGHSTSLWNPSNSRYIFGVRQGIHIISLEATASHLKRAARVVEGVCERAGIVLFVGTRRGQRALVVGAAELSGGCHIFDRWAPGTITNGQRLLESCRIAPLTPEDVEVTGFEEEVKEKLSVLKPDLVVVLNPLENNVLLHECALATIPTIGIIDTDADPTRVTYPIPANDDSMRCVRLISGVLGRAGERGKLTRRKNIADGQGLPYKPFDLLSVAFEDKVQKWAEENATGGLPGAEKRNRRSAWEGMRDSKNNKSSDSSEDGDYGRSDYDDDAGGEFGGGSQAFYRAQLKKERRG